MLPDGTIGLYVEEAYDGASGYSTVFYNFSLEWLTDGDDIFDPTEIAESQTQEEPLKVYPVPASSFVTIEAEGMQTVKVYNALGQLVKTVSVDGTSEVRIEVGEMSSGLYLVETIDIKGTKKQGRFVK